MGIILNLLGILLVVGVMYLCSRQRKAINWSMVGKAAICQFIVALIVVKVPAGVWVVEQISNAVTLVMGYGRDGLLFVFGAWMDVQHTGSVFLVHVLANIVFIGALVNVLTYLGVLGFVIKLLGGCVAKLLKVTNLESFIAVANMFLGQTDSPLLISKYIKNMTYSELLVVLIAGMGSMSVSILGGYNALGVPMDFLIIACTLVPFGSIMLGKLLLPELETPLATKDIKIDRSACGANVLEAMSNGAMDGLNMAIGIAAALIGMIGMVALINGLLGVVGLKLETIFAWLFYPVALLMNLDGDFTLLGAQLLGSKLVINEFVAYTSLMPYMSEMTYRTQAMLCVGIGGFANISSMAVCLSGIGALCPEKKPVLAKLVGWALLGGFGLNILNAMLVGIILSF